MTVHEWGHEYLNMDGQVFHLFIRGSNSRMDFALSLDSFSPPAYNPANQI